MRSEFRLICPVVIAVACTFMTGCVTPIPIAQEAPDLSYRTNKTVLVNVIDSRDVLKEGKPPTYIGRAHGVFGIPADMQTYPWFLTDKAKKKQPLVDALEDRIVFGLNDEGWHVVAVDSGGSLTGPETASLLASRSAERLVVLSVTQWFVSVNLSWVTAVNFDWGYNLVVFDGQGATVANITNSGRDVVDAKADQSYQNLIKLAYRDRLIKILEQPEVQAALKD